MYLTRKEYFRHGKAILSHKEKSTIYYIFLRYEQWKINVRSFDFLDVVNHVNKVTNDRNFNFRSNPSSQSYWYTN